MQSICLHTDTGGEHVLNVVLESVTAACVSSVISTYFYGAVDPENLEVRTMDGDFVPLTDSTLTSSAPTGSCLVLRGRRPSPQASPRPLKVMCWVGTTPAMEYDGAGDMEIIPTVAQETDLDGTWHLTTALVSGNVPSIVIALSAMSHLSRGSQEASYTLSSVRAVIKAINAYPTDHRVAIHALLALWNITRVGKETQESAVAMGAVPTVLGLFVRHYHDVWVVRAVCGVLTNLALRKVGGEDIVECGGVDLIVRAMGDYSNDAQVLIRLYTLLEGIAYIQGSIIHYPPLVKQLPSLVATHYNTFRSGKNQTLLGRLMFACLTLTSCWRCIRKPCGAKETSCNRSSSIAQSIRSLCDFPKALPACTTLESGVTCGLLILQDACVKEFSESNTAKGSILSVCEVWDRCEVTRVVFSTALTLLTTVGSLYTPPLHPGVSGTPLWASTLRALSVTIPHHEALMLHLCHLLRLVFHHNAKVVPIEAKDWTLVCSVLQKCGETYNDTNGNGGGTPKLPPRVTEDVKKLCALSQKRYSKSSSEGKSFAVAVSAFLVD
eukprot:PhF_6_TR32434/c0_g1_i1/m.48143